MLFKKIKTLPLLTVLLAILFIPTSLGVAGTRNVAVKGLFLSSNWSGYVAASSFDSPSSVVTEVSASWTVPAVGKPPGSGYSVIFVGIGGFFSGDETLIQVGTGQFISGNTISYYAWYELLPAPMETITSVSVEPGDIIKVSITMSATDTWVITLDDSDTIIDPDFTATVSYVSSMLSAEWIVERPSLCIMERCHLLQLANYGTATLYDAQTTINSISYSIYDAPEKDTVAMIRGSHIISAVITPVSSGSSDTFTASYKP